MIGFTNTKREQVRELVKNKEFTAWLADISIILNDNSLVFKNNIEYA